MSARDQRQVDTRGRYATRSGTACLCPELRGILERESPQPKPPPLLPDAGTSPVSVNATSEPLSDRVAGQCVLLKGVDPGGGSAQRGGAFLAIRTMVPSVIRCWYRLIPQQSRALFPEEYLLREPEYVPVCGDFSSSN